MLVHVPLFSHPNPMKILIVGGGDGGSAREALRHEVVNRVQQVEIDGGVIAVSKRYFPSLGLALEDPKVNILLMDGAEYLREPEEKFDIILIDSTDPVVRQSQGLFTVSFYRDCLNALTEQGILASQVGDTFFETNLVLSVFAKLKRVFPVVRMYLAPIPSYTLVPYSFAFCSKTVQPELGLGFERFGGDFQVRYYNPQVHHAAFALPEDLKREFER
jgi:spermidine synthase